MPCNSRDRLYLVPGVFNGAGSLIFVFNEGIILLQHVYHVKYAKIALYGSSNATFWTVIFST